MFGRVAIGAGAALLLASVSGAAAAQDARPQRLTAAELQASVAKTKDGLATAQLPTGARGPVVVVARRDVSGEAEVHNGMNDVFVVSAGRASVLVGGRIDGHRQTAPGEWRGGKIVGAENFEIGPGDILWIPAGLPHQVIVPPGRTFTYMAFKSAK